MANLPREDLLRFFGTMILIRRFEEQLVLLTQAGNQFGHFHLYCGEETTGVPLLAQVRDDDFLLTTHRNHGHLLARGTDPGRMLAEIMGRAGGISKGKGGTLHLTARSRGFLSTSAIVGGVVPLATGAGFAARVSGKGQLAVCLFGDGALEEGATYEALNMAALWKLPVVYACENNSTEAWSHEKGGYSGSTNASRELIDVARLFQIPAQTVDGSDVEAVHAATREAFLRARSGGGPTFLEFRTIRYPGTRPIWPTLDSGETDLRMAWDASVIPEAFSEWHREQDGLLRFARELLADRVATREELLALDRRAREAIRRAAEFALANPLPAPETALEGVFA